jgi:hypothetical protein
MRFLALLSAFLLILSFGCSAAVGVSDAELNAFTTSVIATSENANLTLADADKIDCRRLSAYLELNVEDDYCLAVAEDLGIPAEYVTEDRNYKELKTALHKHSEEAKKIQLLQAGPPESQSVSGGIIDGLTNWFTNLF